MNLGTFFQDLAQKIPGNNFAQTRLGDVLTGGVARAINRNDWRLPGYGSDQTSIDDLAAVGTGNSRLYRGTARGVGSLFGLLGLGSALGLGGEAGAAGEAGGGGAGGSVGTGAAEGSGTSAGAGEGATEAGTEGTSLADYLQRYGRQGANLMSRMGQSGGGMSAPVEDNSMIAPIPIADPYAESAQGISPELMALLLNASPRQGDGGTYGLG